MSLVFSLGIALRRQTTNRAADPPTQSGPPVNIRLPVIAGTVQQGQVLTTTMGMWMRNPTGYSVQWWRGGIAILGATLASYAVQAADVGSTLTATITATNAQGSASASSAATAAVGTVVIGMMGQSNIQYTLGSAPVWDNIPAPQRPVIPNPNMTFVGTTNGRLGATAGSDSAFEAWPVTTANVAAKNVSASVGVLSATLGYIMPGQQFALVDLAVSGTGRQQLRYDGNIGTIEPEGEPDRDRGRNWADFAGIITYARAQVGEINTVLEYWYASDQGDMISFLDRQGRFYFGQASDGTPVTLGENGVDHILWDITAAGGEQGRGIFARDRTKLVISEAHPEHDWPKRQGLRTFAADSRVQTFMGHVSPPPLLGAWEGNAHAYADDPDGGIYTMHSWAVPILKAAGFDIKYPQVLRVETASDGSYADIVVSLPNGGNLTTVRALEGRAPDPAPLDDEQAVMGFEVARNSEADTGRLAFVPLAKTGYDAKYRATIVIQDAGTGSGSDRVGRVRITPLVPFASGDRITYIKDYSRAIGTDRQDIHKVWLNYLLETVPAWRDVTATHPFPGVMVAPLFNTLVADVSVAPETGIGAPVILANSTWATQTNTHETARFTPSGQGAIYVVAAIASGSGTGTTEPITSATIGAPGRAAGAGTPLVLVRNAKRSRTGLAIYRVAAPVAAEQTVEIGYSATAANGMRITVVELPHADPGAPVATLFDQSSANYTSRTLTPGVSSAHNGLLYVMTKIGDAADTAITSADVPALFEGDNGRTPGGNGAGHVFIGFEVPGRAQVQSTTFSWTNATSNFQGTAIQVQPAS